MLARVKLLVTSSDAQAVIDELQEVVHDMKIIQSDKSVLETEMKGNSMKSRKVVEDFRDQIGRMDNELAVLQVKESALIAELDQIADIEHNKLKQAAHARRESVRRIVHGPLAC